MFAWGKVALNKILLYFKFALHVEEFGVSESSTDNTTAFNNAASAASSSGKKLIVSPGVYKTVGTINLGALTIDAAPGAIIEHYPTNDTTDAIAIIGLDAGKTIINGLTIKGMQNGHGFGRDLIRTGKGDYALFKNMYLVTPKRDAFQVRPTVSGNWVENVECRNVKVQFPTGVSSTLPSTINSSVTSFTVAPFSSTAVTPYFPDAPFKVQCESEIMLIGAYDRTTNTFSSVTRGVDSTTAASHTSGKTVTRISPKLAAGISSSDTTITLDWSSLYPEAPFNIKVEDEIITVGAINKTTHTLSSLTRGAEGTTAATHAISTSASPWIGRDGFHFELSGSATGTFCNQVNFFNCESRTTPRHALMLQNDVTNANAAQKLSAYEFVNCEFAAADGPHDIVRFQGSPGNGSGNTPLIENIAFRGCTIECTSQPSPKRLGAGIYITGRMSGLLLFENSIIYGATNHIIGHELFDFYDVVNLNTSASVPYYQSHQGLLDKYRSTYTLGLNNSIDVRSLIDGEILSVYVQDQINKNHNQHFFGAALVNGHYVHPLVDYTVTNRTTASNIDFASVPAKTLFINTRCSTDGNVTINIEGTPFVVPLVASKQSTPDLVAETLAAFTYTGYRVLRRKQTLLFTKPDGSAISSFTVTYASTGVTGTITEDAKALRVINKHASETATIEVFLQRNVKDTSN